jgi:hypothetical protein
MAIEELFIQINMALERLAEKKQVIWCPCWSHIRRKFFKAVGREFRQCLNINPREYLEDIMRCIMSHSAQKLHELLPDQWLLNRS